MTPIPLLILFVWNYHYGVMIAQMFIPTHQTIDLTPQYLFRLQW